MEKLLKPIRHRVVQGRHAVLVIDEDPTWVVPTACLSVAFYADPKGVLKYGSNGLHFAEHILWNMIARDYLRQTNASTFNTGEMAVYGICLEDELQSAMTSFFDGLIRMTQCKVSADLKSTFKIEQQRVTCETEFMAESTRRERSESRMFVYNTDMVRSQYSPDYVWKILLEECELGQVVIMAHCKVTDENVKLFETLAEKFGAAWDGRAKNVPKNVLLPMYYAPPYSLLAKKGLQSKASLRAAEALRSSVTIPFDNGFNPVERIIIRSEVSPWGCPYLFATNLSRRRLAKLGKSKGDKDKLLWSVSWDDPFLAVPMLSSCSAAVEEEWLLDLYNLSPKELIGKYRSPAMVKLRAKMDAR